VIALGFKLEDDQTTVCKPINPIKFAMKVNLSKSVNSLIWLEPKVPVLDSYIIKELIGPFLFGVGLFSSLGVTVGAMFELVRKVAESGLSLPIAAQVFLLKMPEFVVLAFPMSIVLATLMVYSRMSSDSEIVALRSCGVSIYRLAIPAFVLSLVVTGMTFAFNEVIVPAANYRASLTLDIALNQEKLPFRENNIFYPEFGKIQPPNGKAYTTLTRLFYAENFDGKFMKGVTIVDRSQYGIEQIVSSTSASWNSAESTWNLYDGTVYLVSPDGSYREIVKFGHKELKLPRTPIDLAQRGRGYSEMNLVQAYEYLELMRLSGDYEKVIKTEVRIQQKYALPFVCVVFALIGAALGSRPQRTGKATSFGISVMIIFSYYLLGFIAGAMGQKGILTPMLAGWLPNILGLGVAMFLLMRTSR
jgi:lipopolysaccharide export system permease protein